MALRRQASGLFGKAFARLTGGAASEAVATCSKLTAASFSHLLSEGGSRRLLQTSAPLMDNLSAILKDELKHEKENYTKPEVIASGPPAPFKLQEQPNDTLVTLTRSHKGEEVVVELHVNAQPSMEFEELEGEEDAAQRVMFNVSVVKGDTALVFECESDGTYVGINHVSYEPKDGFESDSYYTGPVFDELDEQLQGAFGEYLEERGITPELGEYLRHVIYDKEEREYSSWLENVAKFVGK